MDRREFYNGMIIDTDEEDLFLEDKNGYIIPCEEIEKNGFPTEEQFKNGEYVLCVHTLCK